MASRGRFHFITIVQRLLENYSTSHRFLVLVASFKPSSGQPDVNYDPVPSEMDYKAGYA